MAIVIMSTFATSDSLALIARRVTSRRCHLCDPYCRAKLVYTDVQHTVTCTFFIAGTTVLLSTQHTALLPPPGRFDSFILYNVFSVDLLKNPSERQRIFFLGRRKSGLFCGLRPILSKRDSLFLLLFILSLSLSLSVCLSVCLSYFVYVFALSLSLSLSLCLSFSPHSVCLCLSLGLSVCLSVYLSDCLPVSVSLSVSVSVSLSVSVCLSVCLSLCLSLSLSLSVSLSLSLSLSLSPPPPPPVFFPDSSSLLERTKSDGPGSLQPVLALYIK